MAPGADFFVRGRIASIFLLNSAETILAKLQLPWKFWEVDCVGEGEESLYARRIFHLNLEKKQEGKQVGT